MHTYAQNTTHSLTKGEKYNTNASVLCNSSEQMWDIQVKCGLCINVWNDILQTSY